MTIWSARKLALSVRFTWATRHRTRNMLPPLSILILVGCVVVDEAEIMPGVFEISTPASGLVNTESRARVILDQRALTLCPAGYEKRTERVTEDMQGRKTMIWRVARNS
jgi:hypothetical protein